ncbi:restriction endonuclease subunit S [Myroides odoratimimus]|uniref:restriction endonuclease subunit S n=1 Tax=Myroides odoratimimus TaxID=76832 RepID=UPI002575D30D|nr:restriction endonuclease subunit S [Myroides odoratimimus]MDM1467348.1 restriction endonuclease subunit S [Myroides odoratimimus]
MSYKILGDYIRKVDTKNKDLKVLNLQGLSMTKEFRKSTSNIVGTDLSKYKIVKQGQFCCDFMSVIRVHKLPVVLNNLGEDVIISPAYVVFEVVDEKLLLPEYLMLWFRRTEFDRYADFRCDSSIRGGFQWDELCEVELPIPSIKKQRELVAQYQAVANKIQVNEQICEKLEATAQALYKQWFVDFEFPNAEGLPYQSSGGVMVYNEELEKEVPEGWEVKSLGDFIEVTNGYAFKTEDFTDLKALPVLKISNVNDFKVDVVNVQYAEIHKKITKYQINYGDILITLTGSHKTQINSAVGKVAIYNYPFPSLLNQRLSKINSNYQSVIYELVRDKGFREYLMNGATGSANQANISPDLIKSYKVVYPNKNKLEILNAKFKDIRTFILTTSLTNQKLRQLQSLLLSRLARLESRN